MIFATFNVHGFEKIEHNNGSHSLNLSPLLADLKTRNIDVMAIQEFHLQEAKYKQNEPGYTCYFVNDAGNIHHGTGIVIKEQFRPTFTKISARVCAATFKVDNNKHFLFISGYAPHEKLSYESPETRNKFYNDLNQALKLKKSNSFVILGLDANAKTHFDQELSPPNVLGHFTRGGVTNSNGEMTFF